MSPPAILSLFITSLVQSFQGHTLMCMNSRSQPLNYDDYYCFILGETEAEMGGDLALSSKQTPARPSHRGMC